MRVVRLFALVPVALAAQLMAANALDLEQTVKGETLRLAMPEGFCVPDMDNSADAYFVDVVSRLMENAQNKVFQVALDCRDRDRRRAASTENIYDYLVYYYPTASESEVLDNDRPTARKALCSSLRAQDNDVLKDVPKIVEKTAKEFRSNMRAVNSKFMGVLAEDAHGCYAGILTRVSAGRAPSYLMNVVVIASVYRGKTIWYALYSKFVSPAASEKSLQTAKALAAELDLKNPE